MSTTDLEKLVEKVLERNQAAIIEAEQASAQLRKVVEESDRRIEPVVEKLQDAGLIKP